MSRHEGHMAPPVSSAAEVVLGYVRDQVAAISRYDPLVRRDEPDAVHQMRVATRRARSALQAFGGIIERDATRPQLKWLAARIHTTTPESTVRATLAAGTLADPDPAVRDQAVRTPPRSSRRPTARSRVAEWHWELVTDDLLDGLPPAVQAAVRQVADELTVRESMNFPGRTGVPRRAARLRTVQRGRLMLVYLTDVHSERVVITR